MTVLKGYHHFEGRHWITGPIANALAYQGTRAPHTGKPYSEALLMGVSGGLLMGYFAFAYRGIDPHVALLTRNTFDPLDTLLARLGSVQHRRHAPDASKGLQNLLDALDSGHPAIVWADAFSLPYNSFVDAEGGWANFPILVYGYDERRDRVSIADRAAVPLTVTPAELARARARVKQDRQRVLTIEPPDPDKLAGAVRQGIADCLTRYVEAPVKSAKANFGLAGFEHWAMLLTTSKHKQSWSRMFPAGRPLFAGLTSAYSRFGLGVSAAVRDRGLYADFLEEASLLLKRAALREAAEAFRASVPAWQSLGEALLPDSVRPLRDARRLLDQRRATFVEKGGRGLAQLQRIDARLNDLRARMVDDFPMDASGVRDLLVTVADHVRAVGERERVAVDVLRKVAGEERKTKSEKAT